ncbi:protein PEAK3 [Amia ocellicauda]|uniref:protein PEAK3 n=1 Tax=Amia ocellicauda TaxID=2972642 RepID=UPI0034639EBA
MSVSLSVRRGRLSRGSSSGSSFEEVEAAPWSPLSPPPCHPTLPEEPDTPMYCQAPQCPTHSHHNQTHSRQGRIHSDDTEDCPPPLPRKLTRALSLPGDCLLPSYPRGRGVSNPLYMLLSAHHHSQLRNGAEGSYSSSSTVHQHPSCQILDLLTFDTPDHLLPAVLRDLCSQEQVSADLQQRHLLFLRKMARRLEAELLDSPGKGTVQGAELESAGSWQLEDFVLCEGHQPHCQAGGAVYYAVRSTKLPGKLMAAKVHRPIPGSHIGLEAQMSLPPHANIQRVYAHFPQCPAWAIDCQSQKQPAEGGVAQQSRVQQSDSPVEGSPTDQDTSTERGATGSQITVQFPQPPTVDKMVPDSPDGGSVGRSRTVAQESDGEESMPLPGATSYEVSIEGALPVATLADFLREGRGLRGNSADVHQRRLCLLLLQLSDALPHLRRHTTARGSLQPDRLLLVWDGEQGRGGEAGEEGEGMRGRGTDMQKGEGEEGREGEDAEENERQRGGKAKEGEGERVKRGSKREAGQGWEGGSVHWRWEGWGAPRLLISELQPQPVPGHNQKQNTDSDELLLGMLIRECLSGMSQYPREGRTDSKGLSPLPRASPYHRGLQRLASLLLLSQGGGGGGGGGAGREGGVRIEIGGVLQALLWGPRAELFQNNRLSPALLPNWLAVKRSLLVLKLAERGCTAAGGWRGRSLDWEDCLLLRYLSLTPPQTLLDSAALLNLLSIVE